MCGIIGFIKTKQSKQINIENVLTSIYHRGPDEQNYYEDDNVVLGHTRLSIVDIKDGHQPYRYKNLVIVFNGEIYNHKTIRQDLEKKGYLFDTNSDTEVLLKAYDYYGNNFIDKLNGMYAFVIYDLKDNSFVISRDYFGIKPLYIYKYNDEFYFSSEVVSLLQLLKENNIKFELNYEAQKEYLKKGFISENTIIDGVSEIEKGILFRFSENNLTNLKTINFVQDVNQSLENLLIEELKEELEADVEVGVLLSGGIDSSILTALSSKIKNNISTFSVAFENKNLYDESKYAQEVAKKFNTIHHEFLFNEDKLLEYLPKLIEVIDLPIYDPAMLPMLFLSDNVSKRCKVVLSGDGGDELFSGYTHHRVLKYKFFYKTIHNILKKLNILKNKNSTLLNLLNYAINLDESIKYDQNIGLNTRLLRKTDLCSMRYGIEVRVPFLSKKIYNYAKKFKNEEFINLFYGKLPLRKLVATIINKDIAYKKKQGFRVPILEWVSIGKLGETIEYDLRNNLVIATNVINKNKIDNYLINKEKYYKELFSLYLLNNWIKKVK
jgi:asparagine synthase (glutamine-hydrolysing)